MNCNHFESTQSCIRKLIQDIYPVLQFQFVKLGNGENISGKYDEPSVSELKILLKELRAVFFTLSEYEMNLVFPSVLKYFDNKNGTDNKRLPHVSEMQSLTKSKEKLLLNLSEDLGRRLNKVDEKDFPESKSVAGIVSFFLNDFKKAKEEWNVMLKDRMQHCSCFSMLRPEGKAYNY